MLDTSGYIKQTKWLYQYKMYDNVKYFYKWKNVLEVSWYVILADRYILFEMFWFILFSDGLTKDLIIKHQQRVICACKDFRFEDEEKCQGCNKDRNTGTKYVKTC